MLELHPGLITSNYSAYALRFNAPEVVTAVAEGQRKAGLPLEPVVKISHQLNLRGAPTPLVSAGRP
jgi:hypothetical protein